MKPIQNILINWGVFAIYLTLLFTFPVTILGSYLGLIVGLTLSLLFLYFLGFNANHKIETALKLTSLTKAEQPELYHSLNELSRRLNLNPPSLKLLKSDALTIGAYGIRRTQSSIILSEGLLKSMNRSEIIALIARELTAIWSGDTSLATWLSRFFSALEFFSFQKHSTNSNQLKKKYSLKWILFQMLFLPIALIPQYLLLAIRRNLNLNKESLKISHLPSELAESFRRMEASIHRKNFYAPVSIMPLFLISPISNDPISRLLFSEQQKSSLLNSLNQMSKTT